MKTAYAVYNPYVIFGVGNTQEEAVASANEWLEEKTSLEALGNPEHDDSLRIVKCSAELARHVDTNGWENQEVEFVNGVLVEV